MKRRSLLAGLSAIPFATVRMAHGQDKYPSKPITMVVPFPPGGATDNSARLIAKHLSTAIGQPIIIDNRPGASARVGTEAVMRARPDGYTLLFGGIGPLSIAPHMGKVPYDPFKDFTLISEAVTWDSVLVVNAAVPANNLAELIEYIKSKKGSVSFGSSGHASPLHIAGEMFKGQAKVDMTHIPYKGDGPALVDLVGGTIPIMFTTVSAATPHIKSGRIRNLASVGSHRSLFAPDVPTVAEQLKTNYAADSWGGIIGPAGMSPAVVAVVSAAVKVISTDKAMLEQVHAQGSQWVGNSPAEFASFFRNDFDKWGQVIRDNGIKALAE